ncbi:MAG: carboxy terminal-processing peptidase [Verrucomicrobiota bacterium]
MSLIRTLCFTLVLTIGFSWALDSIPSTDVDVKPITANELEKKDLTRLGQTLAALLERYHYSRQRITPEIAAKYFNGLIDYLDYTHMIFYQADVDELKAKWLPTLDQTVIEGDPQMALDVFNRFMMRFQERERMVQKLLVAKYDFTTDESFLPDRSKESFPKDSTEAEKLWRLRVKLELLTGRLNKEKSEETIKTVSRRYARRLKEFSEYGAQDVMDDSLRVLCRTFDPHSDFFSDEDMEDFKIQSIDLKLSGIGAELTVEDGYAKVRRVIPGSPAEATKKVNANDRIVAVGQGTEKPVDVVDMPLRKVVKLIRGKAGTEVRLTIIPADAPDLTVRQVVPIIRGDIELKDAKARARLVEYTDENKVSKRIGIIYLNQFYDNCTDDVAVFVKRFEQERVQGIVLDMRRNGGGLLKEAITLTGLFISKGPVVQVRDSAGSIQIHQDEDSKVSYAGPLVVMVGHQSASATEIVAAALQDYGRALIVGDSATHGKGTVQILQEMDKLRNFWDTALKGGVKFTMQKFYRISGGSTQQKGVTPDIHIPSLFDVAEMGERYLPNYLPYDEIQPSKYQKSNALDALIPVLTKKSEERRAKSDEFKELNTEIEILKKRLQDKSVSLQESKRIQEKTEMKARSDVRIKLRKAAIGKNDHHWDMTLDDVAANKTLDALAKNPPVRPKKNKKTSDDDDDQDDLDDLDDLQLSEGMQILLDLSEMVRHNATSKP